MDNNKIITSFQYNLVQIFASLSLVGFWLVGAVLGAIGIEASTTVNIIYRAILAGLSVLVIIICKVDFKFDKGKSFYSFYIILMVAYSLRMFYDMFNGPFRMDLSDAVFINDITMIVLGVFLSAVALIASRKYLNFDIIAKIVFWFGLIIVFLFRFLMVSSLGENAYMSERVTVGHSLHSLSLVRIGAFEVIAAMHLILNTKHRRILLIIYIIGVVLGLWTALASGARGGFVGLVIALVVFWLFSSRKKLGFIFIAILTTVIFFINIVPILTWLSNYFPVMGERMLLFVVDHDESNRELYRERAFNYILQSPIFGYSYRVNTDITGYTTHNGILDIALALGIPMAIVFVFFFYIKSFIMSVKMMINRRYFYPTVMAIFSIVASMSGSSITSEGWHFSICILLSAFYYNYLNYNNKNTI